MKLKYALLSFAVFASLFISASLVACGLRYNPETEVKAEPEINSGYTLITYADAVALYHGDSLEQVYDVVIDNLPPEDRTGLDNGISFSTREQALKALEDYDG